MARSAQDWPELLPLDTLIEIGRVPAASSNETERLTERAAALQTRAAILRRASVSGGEGRTSSLGARAETLRGDATDMEILRSRLDR